MDRRNRQRATGRTTQSSAPTRIGSGYKETHLHARKLDHVVVIQTGRLRANGRAVDEREVIALAAVDVDDEIAFSTPCDRGDLDARAAERGECLIQFELAARKRAGEHLQFRLLQSR